LKKGCAGRVFEIPVRFKNRDFFPAFISGKSSSASAGWEHPKNKRAEGSAEKGSGAAGQGNPSGVRRKNRPLHSSGRPFRPSRD